MYYFYKHESIPIDLKRAAHTPKQGIAQLIKELQKNRYDSSKGYLYFCESIRLDHVFVIQQTSTGKYRILQSFVNKYTLKANIATQEFVDWESLMSTLQKMQEIVLSPEWTDQISEQYQHLFLSKPWKAVISEYNQYDPDFNFIPLPYLEQHHVSA